MQKHLTAELTGAALDYAVAVADDFTEEDLPENTSVIVQGVPLVPGDTGGSERFRPSHRWDHGGPIIEREWIMLEPWPNESDEGQRWEATQFDRPKVLSVRGATALQAAMRCFVASKLGDSVEVPL